MFVHPGFDPVAIEIGPLAVRWYGLMYLCGFAMAWLLGRWRAAQDDTPVQPRQMEDIIFYGVVGLIVGARVGYVVFYDTISVWDDPLHLVALWRGGMSFHGGLVGLLLAMWFYAWRSGMAFFDIADFIAPLAPLGLFFGRMGNFINGELWGRVTDGPWGVVFPGGGPLPRHPSQLYEGVLEGLVLFAILWWYTARPRPRMAASGIFLLGYGSFRFLVEFVRQPDPQLGFIAFGWLTMGQVLTVPMIVLGASLLLAAYRK